MSKIETRESPRASKKTLTCSVVGARGYAGLETARLLLAHPHAKLTHAFATGDFRLATLLQARGASEVASLRDSELLQNLTDVVFLATPAEVSLELAPKIAARGKTVIDLSGAFRLKTSDYAKWYGFAHTEPSALKAAGYGLSPWAGPSRGETIVANPGCYATAIAMALIPLVKEGLVDASSIVIDAKSGTSGAGKKAAENLLFTEVDGECLPYKVGRHQHLPEIFEAVAAFSGSSIDAHMTTSLLPVRRGIIAGLYLRLRDGASLTDVEAAFSRAYKNYPLVSFTRLADEPSLMSLKKVVGTAKTHISFEAHGPKLYVFSCIDNLLKGAASQAIENFNRVCDVPVETGLSHLEGLL
ncbi:MAG TPA: N-acetyl-gamma-glutamyl-phosphate reductase [Bdellovibrionales bacterium]|nr:N-acetyl-gamma-glutamyl-phosphate reductase [Bdellovibrionales bacterium]